MRIVLGTIFLALALAGCAESQFGGSIFYLTPYNIENMTCADLKKNIDGKTAAMKEKSDLREKAAAEPAGSAVGALVYGPDQNAARWGQRQYQAEYARRNCTEPVATPPVALPPAKPAPQTPLALPPAAPPK